MRFFSVRRGRGVLLTSAAVVLFAVLAPACAGAAVSQYQVHICDTTLGDTNNGVAAFSTNSPAGIDSGVRCGMEAKGYGVQVFDHVQPGTTGDEGTYKVTAPSGTSITGLTYTGVFNAFDGWTAFWRGLPASGSPFTIDGGNACPATNCENSTTNNGVNFTGVPAIDVGIFCKAAKCNINDTSSDFGPAGSVNIYKALVTITDPDAAPSLSGSGTLWDENGQWISGNVPPQAGWAVAGDASDLTGECTLEAYLAPSGGDLSTAVDSDLDNNVTADYTSLLPCGTTLARSLGWAPSTLDTLDNGDYDLHLVASNPGLGVDDQTVTLKIDNDPPPQVSDLSASSSAMGPLGWSSSPTFNLSWTQPPDDPGPQSPITTAVLKECDPNGNNCDGGTQQAATPTNGSITIPSGSAAGDYQGFVWDIDQADNQGDQAPVDLPYDPDPPSAVTFTPARTGPVGQSGTAMAEELSATTGPSGLYGYQVTADQPPSGDYSQINSNGKYDLSTLSDGQHILYARAFSGAGVPGPAGQIVVDIEQNGPGVTVSSTPSIPADGQVDSGGPVTFALGCVDRPDPGCKQITYTIDGGQPQTITGDTGTATVSGIGSHTLTVYTTDKAGNLSGTETVKFSIAAPGTPPPANPPQVFTLGPAPQPTGANVTFTPPVTVDGLIDGTYINARTGYLTLYPVAPSPLIPASVKITLGPLVKNIPCVTHCKVKLPPKTKLKDGVHKLKITIKYNNGTKKTITKKVDVDRTPPRGPVTTVPASIVNQEIGEPQVEATVALSKVEDVRSTKNGYVSGAVKIRLSGPTGTKTIDCTGACNTKLMVELGHPDAYRAQTIDRAQNAGPPTEIHVDTDRSTTTNLTPSPPSASGPPPLPATVRTLSPTPISLSVGQYYHGNNSDDPKAPLHTFDGQWSANAWTKVIGEIGFKTLTLTNGVAPRTLLEDLRQASVAVIVGHASPGSITTGGSGTDICNTTGIIADPASADGRGATACGGNYLGLGYLPKGSLSHLQLLVLVGCNTAANGGPDGNLADEFRHLGAHTVVAFPDTIDGLPALGWVLKFTEELRDGETASAAATAAQDVFKAGVITPKLFGDPDLKIAAHALTVPKLTRGESKADYMEALSRAGFATSDVNIQTLVDTPPGQVTTMSDLDAASKSLNGTTADLSAPAGSVIEVSPVPGTSVPDAAGAVTVSVNPTSPTVSSSPSQLVAAPAVDDIADNLALNPSNPGIDNSNKTEVAEKCYSEVLERLILNAAKLASALGLSIGEPPSAVMKGITAAQWLEVVAAEICEQTPLFISGEDVMAAAWHDEIAIGDSPANAHIPSTLISTPAAGGVNPFWIVLHRRAKAWSRSWLRRTPTCMKGYDPMVYNCDEYPFAVAEEGGRGNDANRQLINAPQNQLQGEGLGYFYYARKSSAHFGGIPGCSIPDNGTYLALPAPDEVGTTTWACNK